MKVKEVLLKILIGAAWSLIQGFLRYLEQSRLNDQSLFDFVANSVLMTAKEHPNWTDDQKRTHVQLATKKWAKELGKDVTDSLVNTVLELTVLKTKVV